MRRRRQRGIALIMVLTLVTLLIGVITSFMASSSLDMVLALGARDELQAEINALSALRMRAIVLRQQTKIKASLQAAGPLLGQAAGGGDISLGPVLEQIPVTCGLLNAISREVDRQAPPGAPPPPRQDFFFGDCEATSKSEHGKISINLLRNRISGNDVQVKALLLGILGNSALRRLFEQDDRTGQHADSPLALINHLTDWVDVDHTEQESFGDEDRYYQYLRDPYRAKNAPMDSVAELKLVHGVNDLLYALLHPNISVHNAAPKIELATASDQILAMGLLRAQRDGAPPEQVMGAIGPVIGLVRQLRSNPLAPLTVQLLITTLQAAGPAAASLFDPAKIKQTFDDAGGTTWYTIEASGSVGRATRKIRVVFQAAEGFFYYARVD